VQLENLAYAVTQLLHNFGAVVVAGGAAFGLVTAAMPLAREIQVARLVALGWAVQIASGAGFGAVSYYFYGRLPDLHGVAIAALTIKITCAVLGLTLAIWFQTSAPHWSGAERTRSWRALAALGATALAAAAFLRWFS
jgi:hypothetical protein